MKAEAFWQLAKCQLFDKAAGFLLASLHTLLKHRQKSSTFLAFSVNTVVHNPATCGADPNLRIPKNGGQKLNIQIRSGAIIRTPDHLAATTWKSCQHFNYFIEVGRWQRFLNIIFRDRYH